MKKLVFLIFAMCYTIPSMAQLKNGEYEIVGYFTESEGKDIRDGKFDAGTISLFVLKDKFITINCKEHPFYAWMIKSVKVDNAKGLCYDLLDVRDGKRQFMYCTSSNDYGYEIFTLNLFWREDYIDKFVIFKKPVVPQ